MGALASTPARRARRAIASRWGGSLVSALCALARGGYEVKDVRQASEGCMLICEIPSDMFSLAGQMLITIQRELEGSSVHANTRIEGQLFDWAKVTAASTSSSMALRHPMLRQ